MNLKTSLKMSRWVLTIISALITIADLPLVPAVPLQLEQPVYCTSKECLQSAASLMWSINTTVDPCENFYRYVCSSSDAFTYGHKNGFAEIQAQMKTMVHKFIEKPSTLYDPKPVQMVRDFYTTCIKDADLSIQTLRKYLRSAGLPEVPSSLSSYWSFLDKFDWVNASVTLSKQFNVDLFASWIVDENVFENGQVLYLRAIPSPESSPLQWLYRIRHESAIKNIIGEVLKDKYIPQSRLDKAVKVIYEMTYKNPSCAKKNDGDPSILEVTKTIRKMTVGKLQNLTDAKFRRSGVDNLNQSQSWVRWIELLVSSITGKEIKVTNNQELYYIQSDLSYLAKIHSYLSKQSAADLELFAWFKAVMFLSKDTIIGAEDRQDHCIELTEKHLNTAVGFGIIPKDFITDIKPEVVEFIDDFKETFAEHIDKSVWLDSQTKLLAKKKIKSLSYTIGAPDWIKNETAVLRTYEDITIGDESHLDNILSITQVIVRNKFKKFINGYDKNYNRETNVEITSANTYYDVLQNFIRISWAMLHSPIYHLGLRSLNYGALGSVLAHEITHGFDEHGIHFDHSANYKRWWGVSSIKKYKNSTGCFVKQYSNFTVNMGGTHIPLNPNKTLNENIADNVGTKIAYYAFQKAMMKKGPEQKLPGFENITSEKMFFLSNAHMWCGEGDDQGFLKQLLLLADDHSPPSHRVNGPLQNLEEFSKTFNCPLGSPMNPDRPRCSVW